HHAQMPKQFFLLRLGEGTAFCDIAKPGNDSLVLGIFDLLFATERNKEIAIGPFGQLGFDIGFSAAEHVRHDTPMKLLEVLVSDWPPAIVQFVILAIEAEQRAEEAWLEEGHQGKEFIDAIFNRR